MSFLSTENDPKKDLLTPRQIEMINSEKAQMIIQAFDLIPVRQAEVIKAQEISKRIDQWFSQFLNPDYKFIPPPPAAPVPEKKKFRGWKSLAGQEIECEF